MLKIHLFGNVQVVFDQQPLILRPVAQNLLAFLLLPQNRYAIQSGYRRDVLTSQLWNDYEEKQARRCLSTTLWRLRQELEPEPMPHGAFICTRPTGEIAFNFDSDHWVDTIAFEANIMHALAESVEEMDEAQVRLLQEACELYTGDFLEGNFSDWAVNERERLNLLYLKCLTRLMQYYDRHHQYDNSLSCGRAILAIDPLREQVHRHMMRMYAKNGQRALAAQQYKVCEKVLADELGIQPMIETQRLFAEICTVGVPIPDMHDVPDPNSLQQVLQQIKTAMQDLERLQGQLVQLKQTITQMDSVYQ